ncbi:hypothetical protein ACH5RR_008458 [Cinchona calisaya]|uniref:Uncharacterized protein n=1 Tax=Cinchona calisaya TaxID=153742 RepID=A0ABD3ADX9_9GENT
MGRQEKLSYVNWVNHVLHNSINSRTTTLEKFRIALPLDHSHQDELGKWIEFAVSRKVQDIEIDLTDVTCKDDSHRKQYVLLPRELLRSQRRRTFFSSLKSMSLHWVCVDDQTADFLLSSVGCPLLERLSMKRITKLKKFEVVGPSLKLKYLEICDILGPISIKICNVASLKSFKNRETWEGLILENAPLLVLVDIGPQIFICKLATITLL